MEVIVATVIVTVAVLGLAYTIGSGRGLVNRYEAARMGLSAAQRRMEILSVTDPGSPEVQVGFTQGPQPVLIDGREICKESWTVTGYDDPANGINPGEADLKLVTVAVTWGAATGAETLQLTQLLRN
ncbi:MAG: hypothetical protein HZC42_06010 [Candidatus Eisenbacteria bacterium]|nr:hypothetical protein [Candidatus Eisenbacteria bacterium]